MPSATILPPPEGHCCHCGAEVPVGQHERAYHVKGTDYVVPVNHCEDCIDSRKKCAGTCK